MGSGGGNRKSKKEMERERKLMPSRSLQEHARRPSCTPSRRRAWPTRWPAPVRPANSKTAAATAPSAASRPKVTRSTSRTYWIFRRFVCVFFLTLEDTRGRSTALHRLDDGTKSTTMWCSKRLPMESFMLFSFFKHPTLMADRIVESLYDVMDWFLAIFGVCFLITGTNGDGEILLKFNIFDQHLWSLISLPSSYPFLDRVSLPLASLRLFQQKPGLIKWNLVDHSGAAKVTARNRISH